MASIELKSASYAKDQNITVKVSESSCSTKNNTSDIKWEINSTLPGVSTGETTLKIGNETVLEKGPINVPTNAIKYRVWDDVENRWLGTVVNLKSTTNSDTYAGIYGHDVCCIAAQLWVNGSAVNDIKYKVHVKGGSWYSEVGGYDTGNSTSGYAGLKNKPIDAFMIKYTGNKGIKLTYRVHTRGGKWLPWVTGYSTSDSTNGYAGSLGKPIDAIQIKTEVPSSAYSDNGFPSYKGSKSGTLKNVKHDTNGKLQLGVTLKTSISGTTASTATKTLTCTNLDRATPDIKTDKIVPKNDKKADYTIKVDTGSFGNKYDLLIYNKTTKTKKTLSGCTSNKTYTGEVDISAGKTNSFEITATNVANGLSRKISNKEVDCNRPDIIFTLKPASNTSIKAEVKSTTSDFYVNIDGEGYTKTLTPRKTVYTKIINGSKIKNFNTSDRTYTAQVKGTNNITSIKESKTIDMTLPSVKIKDVVLLNEERAKITFEVCNCDTLTWDTVQPVSKWSSTDPNAKPETWTVSEKALKTMTKEVYVCRDSKVTYKLVAIRADVLTAQDTREISSRICKMEIKKKDILGPNVHVDVKFNQGTPILLDAKKSNENEALKGYLYNSNNKEEYKVFGTFDSNTKTYKFDFKNVSIEKQYTFKIYAKEQSSGIVYSMITLDNSDVKCPGAVLVKVKTKANPDGEWKVGRMMVKVSRDKWVPGSFYAKIEDENPEKPAKFVPATIDVLNNK